MRAARERHGATLVLVVVMMVVIMAFAAFAIDLSQLVAYQSELQRSADAAAHAGAVELTKAGYATAAAVATAYADSNAVEGSPPQSVSVEYGTWDPAGSTWTAPTPAVTADAVRVSLSGGPTNPIFGGFVGAFGTISVHVSAIAWRAPTLPQHDCLKPLAVSDSVFIQALDLAEGLPVPAGNPSRPLNQGDLQFIRSNPIAPPGGWTYQPVQLYSGDNPGDVSSEIDEPCASTSALAPGNALDANVNMDQGNANNDYAQWCTTTYAPNPCLMKLALVDTSTAVEGATATDGTVCPAAPPTPAPPACVQVVGIVPFIVATPPLVATPPAVGGTFQGYPILGIDEAAVDLTAAGDTITPISRVILVQ